MHLLSLFFLVQYISYSAVLVSTWLVSLWMLNLGNLNFMQMAFGSFSSLLGYSYHLVEIYIYMIFLWLLNCTLEHRSTLTSAFVGYCARAWVPGCQKAIYHASGLKLVQTPGELKCLFPYLEFFYLLWASSTCRLGQYVHQDQLHQSLLLTLLYLLGRCLFTF